jgi:maltose O-acetyltransferase
MLSKIFKLMIRGVLKITPLILFPKLNITLNKLLGYDIEKTARIYSSVQIMGKICVKIGANTFIGHETIITGGGANITIGSNCDISDRVAIFCGTHIIDPIGDRSAGQGLGKDIIIEDGVWIGFGALILPGIKIGKKAIIAAGTVVNKNVQEFTIVGGNPMRVIKSIKTL